MDKGIYCLVFRNPACTVPVGALGEIAFRAGWHVYIGSALGSGGLKRLQRHIALSREHSRPPKWHVDYLLLNPAFSLFFAVSAPTVERLECTLVKTLGGDGVAGFGCSDCSCPTHLLYRKQDPRDEICTAFRSLDLVPAITSIISP